MILAARSMACSMTGSIETLSRPGQGILSLLHMSPEQQDPRPAAFLYDSGPMEIHQWVRSARSHKGWTQQQLAEEIGVTKANVSGWETRRHRPSFSQMTKISQLTGVPLPVGAQLEPSAPVPTRVQNVDAELAAVQVMLLALVNTHQDKAALVRTFDAIVSGIRMHARAAGVAGPSEEMQHALGRFRDQMTESTG